jgi:hypothetical protein
MRKDTIIRTRIGMFASAGLEKELAGTETGAAGKVDSPKSIICFHSQRGYCQDCYSCNLVSCLSSSPVFRTIGSIVGEDDLIGET